MSTNETELDQLRRFNSEKAEALDRAGAEIDDWRSRALKAEAACAEMRQSLDELMLKACEFIGPDEDGHPECVCCGMCLQDNLKGHKSDCLAKAIQDQAHALITDCGKGWVSPTDYQKEREFWTEQAGAWEKRADQFQKQLALAVEALESINGPAMLELQRLNGHDDACECSDVVCFVRRVTGETLTQLKGQP